MSILVILCLAVAIFVVEDAPVLPASTPPQPEDVVAAQRLVRDLRSASNKDPSTNPVVITTLPQLQSAVKLGARLIPGFRGDVRLNGQRLVGVAAIPVPWPGQDRWINLSGEVPAFDGDLQFSRITAGTVDLPPGPTLGLARIAANVVMGDSVGDRLLAGVTSLSTDEATITFGIALSDMGENGIMRGVFGTIRGEDFPPPEQIDAAYRQIRQAMDDGALPVTGSFLPYLHFILSDVSADDDASDQYTAAIFALARACGAREFGTLVGRLAITTTGPDQDWATDCEDLTLNDRIDSRRHFVVSAALRAAANKGVSVAIGEYKELRDAAAGTNGFDFTDIAANLSGIRLTDHMMSLPAADWPTARNQLLDEADVIVSFDGIPGLLPKDDFTARFGTVESPAYQRQVQLIEDRIDGLGLYDGVE